MKKPLPVAVKVLGADLSLRPYGPPPSSEGGLGSKKKWRNKI